MDEAAEPKARNRGALVSTAIVIVAAIIVYAPALWTGYLADDVYQIALFDGVAGHRPPWALYSLFELDPAATSAHMQRGSLPWWTSIDFRFVQLRPLSSLLLALDHTVAHHNAFVHHLHSMAWLVGTLVAAHMVLRRATTPMIAAAALAVFAIDESLGWTVAWLANRCTLVAATFAFLALALHLARHKHDGPPRHAAEFLLWLLAFAAGEYALCGMAYVVAYTLVGRADRFAARLVALGPAALALSIFTLAYVAIGAGVSSATSYIDPLGHPQELIVAMIDRVPRMLGEVALCLPAESERLLQRYQGSVVLRALMALGDIDSPAQLPLIHGRLALAALCVVWVPAWLLARPHLQPDERRAVRWLCLGSLGAVLPLAAIMPSTRALAIAGFGPAALVASVCVAMVRAVSARPRRPWPRIRAALLGVVSLGLLWQHVVADLWATELELAGVHATGRAYETFHTTADIEALDFQDKHVVVLSSPGLVTGLHGQWMMHLHGRPMPASWHVLAVGQRRLLVRRFDDRTLEVSTLSQPMLDRPQETLFRSSTSPMQTGDEVDAGLFVARIVHDRGPQGPDAVQFVFDRALDDPSLVFLETGPTGLRPWTLPPVSRSSVLAPPDLPDLRRAAPR